MNGERILRLTTPIAESSYHFAYIKEMGWNEEQLIKDNGTARPVQTPRHLPVRTDRASETPQERFSV